MASVVPALDWASKITPTIMLCDGNNVRIWSLLNQADPLLVNVWVTELEITLSAKSSRIRTVTVSLLAKLPSA